METLGHSQISLTMDTYTHVMPTLQREAASQMDVVLATPKRVGVRVGVKSAKKW